MGRTSSGRLVLTGGDPLADATVVPTLLGAGDHIVLLPTAAAHESPRRHVDAWFQRAAHVGADLSVAMVLTRRDADDAAAALLVEATGIVLVGDSTPHLRSTLAGTPVWSVLVEAHGRGATVLAGGGSASALCDAMVDRRGGGLAIGLGLVRGVAVATGSESWPTDQLARLRELADVPLVELPTGSGAVVDASGWTTWGDATVRGATFGDLPVPTVDG